MEHIKKSVFIYSFITTIIVCPLIMVLLSGDPQLEGFLFFGVFTFFPVLLFGLPVAIMIYSFLKKINLKSKYMNLIFETVLYLSISILGTYLTMYFISEGNVAEEGIFNKEGLFFILYGALCAFIFQISTHIFKRVLVWK